MKYARWFGALIGFLLFRNPVGGILGFMMGYIWEATQDYREIGDGKKSKGKEKSEQNEELETNIMVLAAAIIRSNGTITRQEMREVRRFLITHFGSANITDRMEMVKYLTRNSFSISAACVQLKYFTDESTLDNIFGFLMRLTFMESPVPPQKTAIIKEIANELGLGSYEQTESEKRGSYFADFSIVSNKDYRTLEVEKNATDEEIKRAYRKLVLKLHPDKFAGKNKVEQRQAQLKFQKVQQAYDNIKNSRGFN